MVLLLIGPLLDTCSLFTMSTEITAPLRQVSIWPGFRSMPCMPLQSFLTVLFLGKPIEEKLDRIKVKYGMMDGNEDEI